jgi:hypothetical protein
MLFLFLQQVDLYDQTKKIFFSKSKISDGTFILIVSNIWCLYASLKPIMKMAFSKQNNIYQVLRSKQQLSRLLRSIHRYIHSSSRVHIDKSHVKRKKKYIYI